MRVGSDAAGGRRLAPPLTLGLPGLEQLPAALLVADAAGRILYANRATGRLWATAPTALVGRRLRGLFAATDRPTLDVLVASLARGPHRPPWAVPTRLMATRDARYADASFEVLVGATIEVGDGGTRLVCNVTRLRSPAGCQDPDAEPVPTRDGTQGLNHQLDRWVRQYRRARTLVAFGEWSFEVTASELHWSEDTFRMLGYEVGAVQPSVAQFRAAVHPDDWTRVWSAITTTLDTGRPWDITHRILRPDGELRHVRAVGELELCADGRPSRLVGTAIDITDEVQHRERLEATVQLAASVLDSMCAQGVLLDAQGRVLRTNASWRRFAERTGSGRACEGQHHCRVERLGGSGRASGAQEVRDGVAEVLAGRATRFQTDYRIEVDGEVRWFELTATPLRGVPGALLTHEDITARGAAAAAPARRALHAPVTELPDRALLLRRAEEALAKRWEPRAGVGLLFIDVDRFKVINDRFGHTVGDALLRAIAARVRATVGASDLVCRVGGDEFVVLTTAAAQARTVQSLAERLCAAFQAPVEVGDRRLDVTVSIGVATNDVASSTAEDLLRDADIALHRAKEQGRARVVVHDEGLRAKVLQRAQLESDLRGAAGRGELVLHYQPQLDLCKQRLVGLEALLRWNHPELGLLPPGRFIGLAEEAGLILGLGEWVLEEAVRQAALWRVEAVLPDTGYVAINISPRHLTALGFVARVREALQRHDLSPDGLCVEVTESGLTGDVNVAADALGALRRIGVRTALDDFGTGHASLDHLSRFPLDEVKIDRSFVACLGQDPQGEAVASSILALAAAFGLSVVAEGIETDLQLDWLLARGCTTGQGFLFSAARPPGELQDAGPRVFDHTRVASADERPVTTPAGDRATCLQQPSAVG